MKLKQIPEDFYVREVINLELNEGGNYLYYILKKNNRDSFSVFQELGNIFGVRSKDIGFAGVKDKRAITEQFISVFKPRKFIEEFQGDGFQLTFYGKGNERINIGDLEWNVFTVVVRDLDSERRVKSGFKNFYDEQRFGVEGDNHVIGGLIVKGKYKDACEKLDLYVNKKDYIGALREVGVDKLRFYVNAYQSYLWNKAAEEIENVKEIPLVGYLTQFKSIIVKRVYERILKQEGVKKEDFLFKSIPELQSEGAGRRLNEMVHDLKVFWDKDEFNEGKLKCILEFRLRKGAYATTFLKQTFGKVSD